MIGGRRERAAVLLGVLAAIPVSLALGQGGSPPATPASAPAPALSVPDASAPFVPFADAWPRRWGDDGAPRGHGVIVPRDVKATRLLLARVPGLVARPASADDVLDAEALKASVEGGAKADLRLEGPNGVVFEEVKGKRPRGIGTGPGSDAGPEPALVFVFVSGTPAAAEPGATPVIDMQRTWFVYYDPLNAGGGVHEEARRGVMIIPGIFGNPDPVIDRVVRRLRAEGYGVLRMLSPPSRFVESHAVAVDAANPAKAAQYLASTLGDRAAECAYACEAAWNYVEKRRPSLAGAAHAGIGMSGGAIVLPTVYARNPARYGAVILMAGGADCWLINERSNYSAHIGALRTMWPPGAPPGLREEADRAYLAASPLDPYHTAAALRGKRVLVLQGQTDMAVPAALGDLLWERLGRPERWSYPVGHEFLFAGLPDQLDRIVGWLGGDAGKTPDAR